ncbi:MAG: tyrosine-type recombinase/integrase [Anaerolineae bacterium]|nr:tyrosine-type recombinase/integrase [Anaerolineae bacterium]
MNNNNKSFDPSETLTFLRVMNQRKRNNGKKTFAVLDEQIRSYLIADQQQLCDEIERAKKVGDDKLARSLGYRLQYYSVIKNFFLFLYEHRASTRLEDITNKIIELFLTRERPITLYKGKATKSSRRKRTNSWARTHDQTELKAFFARAIEAGVIQHNPVAPLVKTVVKLEPRNPSSQTKADCLAFKNYLQLLIDHRQLSDGTARMYYIYFLILLSDAEAQNHKDPNWPTELDALFSSPKWVSTWLKNLENRSPCTESKILARSSVKNYLKSIRHVWLFLSSQGRASQTYFSDLQNTFKFGGSSMLLPGRAARVIEALSEAEEQAVFHCIAHYSSNPVLMLRDKAMFITALETAVRVDGLNSMRIENFEEIETGIWTCLVRAKRSAQKNAHKLEQLDDDNLEWRQWFVSEKARSVIQDYLEATGRNWNSRGPVWLANDGKPLSYKRQKSVLKDWLEIAGCKFTRAHVLRHTAIDRLVNKYNLPIPIVQTISQHATPTILLQVYSRRAKIDAFRIVNQLFPADDKEGIGCKDLMLSIGAKLNQVSAGISQRAQAELAFNHKQAEELLELLRHQIERITKFLGYESVSEVVLLSLDDYKRIEDTLQLMGLSYQKVLGYEPKPSTQTVTKAGRKPKSLLH